MVFFVLNKWSFWISETVMKYEEIARNMSGEIMGESTIGIDSQDYKIWYLISFQAVHLLNMQTDYKHKMQ